MYTFLFFDMHTFLNFFLICIHFSIFLKKMQSNSASKKKKTASGSSAAIPVDTHCVLATQGASVLKDYNCMLNQANIAKNMNKYYVIQVCYLFNIICYILLLTNVLSFRCVIYIYVTLLWCYYIILLY